MKRRRYLALLGAGVGLAGCSSGTESTPTATDTATATSTETPTDAPTATQTETATPTETATDTPTETDEPTPSQAELTRQSLSDARTAFNDAIAEYERAAGVANVSLLDVGLETEFEATRVEDALNRAQEALTEATSTATGDQTQTIEQLRGVRIWIQRAAEAQETVWNTNGLISELQTAVYNTDGPAMQSTANEIDASGADVDTDVAIMREGADPSDFDELDIRTDVVADKEEQFEAFATGFRQIGSVDFELQDGMTPFANGINEYQNEEYTASTGYFVTANGEFSTIADRLSPSGRETKVDDFVSSWSCAFGSLAAAAEDLQTSAEEIGQYNSEQNRQRFLEQAKEHLSGCSGELDDFSVVQQVRSLN